MFDGRLAGGALDYAAYHTAHLDSLFVLATRAETEADLAAAWKGIQSGLAQDVPVSWIYHARGVQGLSRKLQAVRMDLRGEMATLAQWRFDTPRAGS
jgi:peptide/nickel transport system substrate-binding protein